MRTGNTTDGGLVLQDVYVEVPDGLGARTLLDHVDLAIAGGDVVVITGGSGSGKSTLLAVAGLLRRPAGGDVLIGGRSTKASSERARTTLRRDHVAIVYQSANLLPSLTAREQLELVAHIHGERRASAKARAQALLADVGLAGLADRLPARMSGGERQRVGIARALMADPTVLLADEPTASLDPTLAAEVCELLVGQARARGLATMIVSHDDEPLAVADRHLHLADGALEERDLVRG